MKDRIKFFWCRGHGGNGKFRVVTSDKVAEKMSIWRCIKCYWSEALELLRSEER